jgi:hypothetical protein
VSVRYAARNCTRLELEHIRNREKTEKYGVGGMKHEKSK